MPRPSFKDSDSLVASAASTTLTISSFNVSATAKTLIVFATRDDAANTGFAFTGATFDGNSMDQLLIPSSNMISEPSGRYTFSYMYDVTNFSGPGDIVVSQSSRPNTIIQAYTVSGYIVCGWANTSDDNDTWCNLVTPYNGDNMLLVSSMSHDNNTSATADSGQTEPLSDTVSNIIVKTGWQNAGSSMIENEWAASVNGEWTAHNYLFSDRKPGAPARGLIKDVIRRAI